MAEKTLVKSSAETRLDNKRDQHRKDARDRADAAFWRAGPRLREKYVRQALDISSLIKHKAHLGTEPEFLVPRIESPISARFDRRNREPAVYALARQQLEIEGMSADFDVFTQSSGPSKQRGRRASDIIVLRSFTDRLGTSEFRQIPMSELGARWGHVKLKA